MRSAMQGGLCAILLGACASSPPQPVPGEAMVQCPTPRPQVCTRDYRPVCAVLGNDERKQYSNGCSACGDEAVTGYVAGPCEQSVR